MIKTIRKYVVLLITFSLVFGSLSVSTRAEAKSTKEIIIAQISGNTLKYHKAGNVHDVLNTMEWETIIGYGKQKTIKLSPKTQYYLLDLSAIDITSGDYRKYKVSKKKFVKNLFDYRKAKENGITYYDGMACKMTIKNGKCIKLVQEFQA